MEANKKSLEKTLPTANDLLKTIQDQEKDAHTNGSFLVNAALSCTNSVVQVMQDAMEGAKGNSVVASPSTKQSSIAASFPQVLFDPCLACVAKKLLFRSSLPRPL